MDWKGLKEQIKGVNGLLVMDNVPHKYNQDASGWTVKECLEWIKNNHEDSFPNNLIPIYGNWDNGDYDGCASFLLIDYTTGKFYEINGSHCSCYGFEGQFTPSECPIEYLAKGKQWSEAYSTVLEVVEFFEKNPIN